MHRIRIRASNNHAIPTLSARYLQKKIGRKDMLKIEGRGLEVVSGGIVSDLQLDRVSNVENRPWLLFTDVPSFGKRDVQWIVKGSGKATVTFDALKAKNQILTLDL